MGKNILLVKTSSLGDVIHALPAVTDALASGGANAVDWAVEEALVSLPRLHPGVADVLPVAIRRWRKTLWRGATRAEIAQSMRRVRGKRYGAVIDAQGLFKSVLVALAARGPRFGLGWRSVREPIALFYDRTFDIPWSLHAVERNRLLLARALGYGVPSGCDYGIRAAPRRFDWLPADRFAVLLHASSGDYKLWPESSWVALGNALRDQGIHCVVPWGSAKECDRAGRIAGAIPFAAVAPALRIEDFPPLFAGACAVIGVDTGLTHLAAALGAPTVGIYCGTDPAATGIYGCAAAVNVGGIGVVPGVTGVVDALAGLRT